MLCCHWWVWVTGTTSPAFKMHVDGKSQKRSKSSSNSWSALNNFVIRPLLLGLKCGSLIIRLFYILQVLRVLYDLIGFVIRYTNIIAVLKMYVNIQCCEKVFAPLQISFVCAFLSCLTLSDHQRNVNIKQISQINSEKAILTNLTLCEKVIAPPLIMN